MADDPNELVERLAALAQRMRAKGTLDQALKVIVRDLRRDLKMCPGCADSFAMTIVGLKETAILCDECYAKVDPN